MAFRTILAGAALVAAGCMGLVYGCGLYTDGVFEASADASLDARDGEPCAEGLLDCDGDGVCETNANDPRTCGACNNDCHREGQAESSVFCAAAQCVYCEANRAECDQNPANGCETDLNAPESCGACGHSCLGGACATGQCQPAVFASVASAGEIAIVDGGVVATVGSTSVQLFVEDAAAGAPIATDLASPVSPVADEAFAYWVSNIPSGGVWRGALDGSDAGLFSPNSPVYPSSVLLHEGYVYWTSGGVNAVAKTSRTAPAAFEAVATGTPALLGSLTTDGTSLFWLDITNARVCSVPLTAVAGTCHVVGTIPGPGVPSHLVLASDGIYVITSDAAAGAGIFRISPSADAGVASLIAYHDTPALPPPTRLVADDKYVYYTDNSAAGVVRRLELGAPPIDVDGGPPSLIQPEIVATGQSLMNGIAVDDRAVYWTESRGIVRLAK